MRLMNMRPLECLILSFLSWFHSIFTTNIMFLLVLIKAMLTNLDLGLSSQSYLTSTEVHMHSAVAMCISHRKSKADNPDGSIPNCR